MKKVLKDYGNWTNEEFERARGQMNYINMTLSWIEQRQFINWSLEALKGTSENGREDHPLLPRILSQLSILSQPPPSPSPSFSHLSPSSLQNLTIDNGYFLLSFNSSNGAINRLMNKTSGREWASNSHLLSLYQYQTETPHDYYQFESQYFYCHPSQCDWELKVNSPSPLLL